LLLLIIAWVVAKTGWKGPVFGGVESSVIITLHCVLSVTPTTTTTTMTTSKSAAAAAAAAAAMSCALIVRLPSSRYSLPFDRLTGLPDYRLTHADADAPPPPPLT